MGWVVRKGGRGDERQKREMRASAINRVRSHISIAFHRERVLFRQQRTRQARHTMPCATNPLAHVSTHVSCDQVLVELVAVKSQRLRVSLLGHGPPLVPHTTRTSTIGRADREYAPGKRNRRTRTNGGGGGLRGKVRHVYGYYPGMPRHRSS